MKKIVESLLLGVARIADIGGTLDSDTCEASHRRSDAEALHGDWCAVGDDLRSAMAQADPSR